MTRIGTCSYRLYWHIFWVWYD